MITIYPYEKLGHADHGWLNARHHFSFANYYNPKRTDFGVLRVINDDIIKAGAGFDMHPHKHMEIITYVRKGAISHRDNKGNEGRTEAGDVQVISAGTGIFHSEYNLESVDCNLYQIWIEPSTHDVRPAWNTHAFPKEPVNNALTLLVSGDGKAPLQIHQDAYIHAGRLTADQQIQHPIHHQAYLLVSEGEIVLEGKHLRRGDGAEISGTSSIHLHSPTESEVLVIDVPERNINSIRSRR